jgi:serine/threonine-protein kinase RsbT
VRATDQGPGIPNLNEVLSGRYRSKTGLGKGLIGVKRLATRFTIHTDASGTHIEAEVRL